MKRVKLIRNKLMNSNKIPIRINFLRRQQLVIKKKLFSKIPLHHVVKKKAKRYKKSRAGNHV